MQLETETPSLTRRAGNSSWNLLSWLKHRNFKTRA